MEETALTRHTLVFLAPQGKVRLEAELCSAYFGEAQERLHDIFAGEVDIPGIVRRAEEKPHSIAVGFVPWRRLENGNRLRVATYVPEAEVRTVVSPYELDCGNLLVRSRALEAAGKIYALAADFKVKAGFLGSVGLEIATGLPYTDDASDLDVLLKPAAHDRLLGFYRQVQRLCPGIAMDFEVELPNGYGVKLAELFMDTRTVLGKSLTDVRLLDKEQTAVFLQ